MRAHHKARLRAADNSAEPTVAKGGVKLDPTADYHFLLETGLNSAALASAARRSLELNVELHDVLIADGVIPAHAYVQALARHLGVAALAADATPGSRATIVDGTVLGPALLAVMALDHRRHGMPITLATPELIATIEGKDVARARLGRAVRGLRRLDPALSAADPIALWQTIAIIVALGIVIGSALVAPSATRAALMLAVSLPFFDRRNLSA